MYTGITHYYIEGNEKLLSFLAEVINDINKTMYLVHQLDQKVKNFLYSHTVNDIPNIKLGIGNYSPCESCFNVLIALGIKTVQDYEGSKKEQVTEGGIRTNADWCNAELLSIEGKTILKFDELCLRCAKPTNFDKVAQHELFKGGITKINHYFYGNDSIDLDETDDTQERYLAFEKSYIDKISFFDDDED